MYLWLDDVRPMPNAFDYHAKTAEDAIEQLKTGNVQVISFDHDLGEEINGTGYDVACYIEKAVYLKEIPMPNWQVHSANPVGKKNIERAMKSAEKFA